MRRLYCTGMTESRWNVYKKEGVIQFQEDWNLAMAFSDYSRCDQLYVYESRSYNADLSSFNSRLDKAIWNRQKSVLDALWSGLASSIILDHDRNEPIIVLELSLPEEHTELDSSISNDIWISTKQYNIAKYPIEINSKNICRVLSARRTILLDCWAASLMGHLFENNYAPLPSSVQHLFSTDWWTWNKVLGGFSGLTEFTEEVLDEVLEDITEEVLGQPLRRKS